jgi:putative endonuclease
MQKGQEFEARAAQILEQAGMQILDRNFRCKVGEIDIICRRGNQLVFVEVRCRQNPRYASAAASITPAKQRRLWRTAQLYLQRRGWSDRYPCRFDVIAFSPTMTAAEDGIQWLQNAFTM